MTITLIVLAFIFTGVLLAALHKKGMLGKISLPGLPRLKADWKLLSRWAFAALLVWFFWVPITSSGKSLMKWRDNGFKNSFLKPVAVRTPDPILPCQLDWDDHGVLRHFECRPMSTGIIECTGRGGTFIDRWDSTGNGEWFNTRDPRGDRGKLRNLRFDKETNSLRGERNNEKYSNRGWYSIRIRCDQGVKGLELGGSAPSSEIATHP